MRSHKRLIHSALLNRMAHADVFEIGNGPAFLFMLFGGSGIDDEEYERRAQSVIPLFGQVLEDAARRVPSFVFAHVTAPYDLAFRGFPDDPPSAERWNAHVASELLEPWAALPYFVCGFSGGALLALSGLHRHPRCIGGAALGADALPRDFVCPEHWAGKLRLYATPNDTVCNHPANRRAAEALAAAGEAERFGLRSGGHRLSDYATQACLGELIGFAQGLTRGAAEAGNG